MEFLGRSYYEDAVYHSYNYGPNFNDFEVDDGPSVCWRGGCIYENDPSWPLKCDEEYVIKEMKVFQVTPRTSTAAKRQACIKSKKTTKTGMAKQVQVNEFTKEINDAINDKWKTLRVAKDEMTNNLEESIKFEETFIFSFASGQTKDLVTLNVCGKIMMTHLQTVCASV